jgi:predicted RNase H-like nuclease (RuvC/YqgF family)
MPSSDAKVKKLEKKVTSLEKKLAVGAKADKANKAEIAKLKQCCKDVEKWIKGEVKWSKEVTGMLRRVNWNDLEAGFPPGPGDPPPLAPPDWPVT